MIGGHANDTALLLTMDEEMELKLNRPRYSAMTVDRQGTSYGPSSDVWRISRKKYTDLSGCPHFQNRYLSGRNEENRHGEKRAL